VEQINSALRVKEQCQPGTRIICAASTREGEELLIIKAWKELLQNEAELLAHWRLLIVPRHPQRFSSVYDLLLAESLSVQKRSDLDKLGLAKALDQHSVILGDSMGEMSFYYALSDIVVMGGSLLPLGGQNFIEACALGCPIILGEHTFNFHQASLDAIHAGAAIRIASLDQLAAAMSVMMKDISVLEEMSSHAIDYADQHMGATQKTMNALQEYL
jgi:3-deoxy-D-manno-octulosonic-acid transferase